MEGYARLCWIPCGRGGKAGGTGAAQAALDRPPRRIPVFPIVKLLSDTAGSAAGRGRVLMLMRRPEAEAEYLALHGGGTETAAETRAAQADPANIPS